MRNETASKAKTTYPQMATDMWKKLKLRDQGLIPLCFLYSFFAAIYPLFGVVLPRLLISQIEQADGFNWQSWTSFATQNIVIRNIFIILLGYLVLAAIFGGFTKYISNLSYARFSYLRLDYLRDISRKVLTMDFKHYENAGFMDQINRINQAVQSNHTGVEAVYRNSFMLPAKLLSLILLLFSLARADIILLILPLLDFGAILYVRKKTNAFVFSQRDEISHTERRLHIYGDITQDFTYGKDVRLFNLKTMILTAYDKMIGDRIKQMKLSTSKEFKYSFLSLATKILNSSLTLGILVYKALNSQILIAEFAFYLAAYVTLNQITEEVSLQVNNIANEGRYVREMIDFLGENLNLHSGENQLDLSQKISIEFENVSFHYPNSDKLVLEKLNLKITEGEKLALVGINGAGKSTFVKLMTGLHQPSSGKILINGQDTRKLDTASILKAYSVVFQEENPIAITVAQHIAGSLTDINRDKIRSVLQRVDLLDKIEAEPKGMDTILLKVIDKEGLVLSGGENQKLMLARALYKDAPIMVLDEPTSALDALAETKVYQEFADILTKKTGLFISHRLASTSFCDRIALLSGGKITEIGTHQELMQNQAEYYKMFITQGKYYQEREADNG